MPNHVINEVVFHSVFSEDQEAILKAVAGKDGKVDFSVILPPPINSWRGSVGQKHKVFPTNDLDWCTKNWSTKWNAYGERSIERSADTLTLTFQTAWSAPYGWLVALFNTLNLSFEYCYLEEGQTDAYGGYFDYAQKRSLFGDAWKEDVAPEEVRARLHTLLFGEDEDEEDKDKQD